MNVPRIIKQLYFDENVHARIMSLMKYPKLICKLYYVTKKQKGPKYIFNSHIIAAMCDNFNIMFKPILNELISNDFYLRYTGVKCAKCMYKTNVLDGNLRGVINDIRFSIYRSFDINYSIPRYFLNNIYRPDDKWGTMFYLKQGHETPTIFIKKECKLTYESVQGMSFIKCSKGDLMHYNLSSKIVGAFTSKNLFNLSKWFAFVI